MMAQLWRLHRHGTAMAAWVGEAPGGLNAKDLNRRPPGRHLAVAATTTRTRNAQAYRVKHARMQRKNDS